MIDERRGSLNLRCASWIATTDRETSKLAKNKLPKKEEEGIKMEDMRPNFILAKMLLVILFSRSRISSRKPGEPIPEHHIMPGSRSWRPLNSRKRLHCVTESPTESDQSNGSISSSTATSGSSKKAKSCSDSQSEQELSNLGRSKSEDAIIQKALEKASDIEKSARNITTATLNKSDDFDSDLDGSVGRYFENKFDRKSAKELKNLIQSESGDVTAWIELAKWTENNPQLRNRDEIQKAKLSVLARALEVNKSSVQLWNFYVTEFAKSSFNTIKSVTDLCNEALAYVASDFILFLVSEKININEKIS